MKKAIVFPYNKMIADIFEKQSFADFEIISYVSYPCIITDTMEMLNTHIEYDYKAVIETVDIVIWAEYLSYINGNESSLQKCKKDIFEVIEFALEHKKTIYCCELLSESERKHFETKAQIYNCCFVYYCNELNTIYESKLKKQNIEEITIPTVFIEGATLDCCKFQLQILVRRALQNEGMKISQIGTKHYCELFGFHSFPSFMYKSDIGEISKINMFNAFLCDIVSSEKPDILIIGIPHGFFNEIEIDNYGILHYMISCAITSSITFVSLPFFDYNKNFFNELEKILNYRYCQCVGAFFASNIMKDLFDDNKEVNDSFCILPHKLVDEEVSSLGINNLYTYTSINSNIITSIIRSVYDYGSH